MAIVSHGKGFADMQAARKLVAADVLLVYIAGNSYSKQIVDYYSAARSVPSGNILALPLSWASSSGLTRLSDADSTIFIDGIASFIRTNTNIRCIVLCGEFPTKIGSNYGASYTSVPAATLTFAASRVFFLKRYNANIMIDANGGQTCYTVVPAILKEMMKPYMSEQYEYRNLKARGSIVTSWITPQWEQGKEYAVGDEVTTTTLSAINDSVSPPTGYNARTLKCTIAGISGATEPMDVSGTITDGSVTWDIGQQNRDVYQSEKYRISKTYYDDMKEALGGKTDWETQLAYPVCKLDAPYVSPLDPYNTSKFDIVKRMIDDAIYTESLNLTKIPGSIFIGESSTVPTGGARISLEEHGYAESDYYYGDHSVENGAHGAYSFDASTRYPAGATTLFPSNPTSSYPVQDDVFIHYFGEREYFNNTTRPPIPTGVFSYMRGAIEISSQSFGFVPNCLEAADFFYDDYTLEPSYNNSSSWNDVAVGSKYSLLYKTAAGNYTIGFMRIEYSGAGVARYRVPSNNVIELEVDGVVVQTISLTTGPFLNIYDYIRGLSIATSWTITLNARVPESRGVRALRSGAAVAIGTEVEPYAGGAPQGALILGALLSGACIAESTIVMSANAMNGGSELSINSIYGDPLYRPFNGMN